MYKLRVMIPAAVAALAVGLAFGYAERPQTVTTPAVPAGDVVYGNPVGGAPFWFHQTVGDCAEASSSVVIGELTPTQPTEAAIVSYATAAGYYTPGTGTAVTSIPLILEHYGVQAEVAGGQTMASMEASLQYGDKVIVAVNAETIWATQGFKVTPGTVADHAVVVDSVDATAGTVTLTDTGSPKGATEVVTVATFEQAWSASGNAMVVANG